MRSRKRVSPPHQARPAKKSQHARAEAGAGLDGDRAAASNADPAPAGSALFRGMKLVFWANKHMTSIKQRCCEAPTPACMVCACVGHLR